MVVSIEEIAPLGGSFGEYAEPTCWFCVFDYRCYDGETLRNRGVGKEERTPENGYIPLFRTNMRAVVKDFLRSQSPKEYEPIFEEYEDFDKAFNIFLYRCSLYKKWILYRNRRLKRDAVRWCEEHHLPWKSTDVLLYPFEYWSVFLKENFRKGFRCLFSIQGFPGIFPALGILFRKSHIFSDRYLLLTEKYAIMLPVRGCSSAGRALRSQRRGHGFEPHHLHQKFRMLCHRRQRTVGGCWIRCSRLWLRRILVIENHAIVAWFKRG